MPPLENEVGIMSNLSIREAFFKTKEYFPDDEETQQNSLIATVGVACDVMFKQGCTIEQIKESIASELLGINIDEKMPLLIETAINESWKRFLRNTPTTKKINSIRASDLMKMSIPAPEWAVQNLIPAGLSVLASPPKVGKSFFCLQLALAVATGQPFLDHRTEKGSVLYISLEDSAYSLQKRLSYFLEDHRKIPSNLYLTTEFPQLDAQGLLLLDQWLATHSDARLVIIDTWGKTKPNGNRQKNAYESDVELVSPIKKLADRNKTSIMLVHHLKKGGGKESDWLESLSGSMGLAATVDGLLSLYRDRGAKQGILKRTGRNFEEDDDIGLEWTAPGWRFAGDAREVLLSESRQTILNAIRQIGEPASAKLIAEVAGKNHSTTRVMLRKMYSDRIVSMTSQGKYFPALESVNSVNSINTVNSVNSVNSVNTFTGVYGDDESVNTDKASDTNELKESVYGVYDVYDTTLSSTTSHCETDPVEGGEAKNTFPLLKPSQKWLETAPPAVKEEYNAVLNRLKVFLSDEMAKEKSLERAWEFQQR
jgi:hypothetical protein